MKTTIWGIDDVMENVEGWFLRDEAITLDGYARLVSAPATIVEIGSIAGGQLSSWPRLALVM